MLTFRGFMPMKLPILSPFPFLMDTAGSHSDETSRVLTSYFIFSCRKRCILACMPETQACPCPCTDDSPQRDIVQFSVVLDSSFLFFSCLLSPYYHLFTLHALFEKSHEPPFSSHSRIAVRVFDEHLSSIHLLSNMAFTER